MHLETKVEGVTIRHTPLVAGKVKKLHRFEYRLPTMLGMDFVKWQRLHKEKIKAAELYLVQQYTINQANDIRQNGKQK